MLSVSAVHVQFVPKPDWAVAPIVCGVSVTVTPVAGSGPALATEMPYATGRPLDTGSGPQEIGGSPGQGSGFPSVLLMERSADADGVTVIGAVGPVGATEKPSAVARNDVTASDAKNATSALPSLVVCTFGFQ